MDNKQYLKKIKVKFDEISMEYNIENSKKQNFGDIYDNVQDMIKEVNDKCVRFYDFGYYLKHRQRTIKSIFIILPLVFLMGVIGFTAKAFALSWFFFSFFFFSIFFFFALLYFWSSRINRKFIIYSQITQEIIDKYNTEFFIQKNVFAYFRTRSIDYNPLLENKREKKYNQFDFQFKFYVQSRLLRIIRNFFWIEFVLFKTQENIIKNRESPEKNFIVLNQGNLKQSINLQESDKISENEKENEDEDYNQNSKKNSNYNNNDFIHPKNSHISNLKQSAMSYQTQQNPKKKNMYASPSPNIYKFDESSAGGERSKAKTINEDKSGGVNAKKYFDDNDDEEKNNQKNNDMEEIQVELE